VWHLDSAAQDAAGRYDGNMETALAIVARTVTTVGLRKVPYLTSPEFLLRVRNHGLEGVQAKRQAPNIWKSLGQGEVR
jgi:hypothetical protein